MNQYKKRATALVNQVNLKTVLPVLFFITILSNSTYLFGESIISVVIAFLFICIGQGNIQIAKYILANRSDEIEVSNQGMIGIKQYKKYFSTYFFYNIFQVLFSALILVGAFLFYTLITRTDIQSLISLFEVEIESLEQLESIISQLIIPFVFSGIAVLLFNIYYTLTYTASKYLVTDTCKGIKALKASREAMSTHRLELLQLYLSYILEASIVIAILVVVDYAFNTSDRVLGGTLIVVSKIISSLAIAYFIELKLPLTKLLYFNEIMDLELLPENEIDYQKIDDLDLLEPIEEINGVEDDLPVDELGFEPIGTWKLIIGCLLFVPFYLSLASYVLSMIFMSIPGVSSITDEYSLNAWYNFFYDGVLLLMGMIWFREFFKKIFTRFVRCIKENFIWFVAKGYLILYGSSILSSMVVTLITQSNEDSLNQTTIEKILAVEPIPMLVSVIIFAPILEELVFRGVIFRTLRKLNKYLAHLVSAFLFGFIHVASAILVLHQYAEFIQIIPYFVMGLVFSIYYEKYKCIGVNIFLHMLNNLSSCIIILLL